MIYTDNNKIRWEKHYGTIVDQVKTFDIIDCEVCNFRHITPIPTEKELEKIYKHEYYSAEKPLYITQYEEDSDWWNIVYKERYDTFTSLLSTENRTILDIGSGPGLFLKYGQDSGWITEGVEPSLKAAEYTRNHGIKVNQCMLTRQTATQLESYDVIHLSSVLEHVPDPCELVNIAKNLLNDSGIICVVVPNDYNPFQDILRQSCDVHPWWIIPPHHINYFTFDSLKLLLEREGFTIELVEGTFPIDLFLLMGDMYIGNDELGRSCHKKRMKFEQNLAKAGKLELKRSLYKKIAELGIGREIVIYARK